MRTSSGLSGISHSHESLVPRHVRLDVIQ